MIFPFSCSCAYACVCAARSEKEIPLRHHTNTTIFTTRGYVWPMKTLDPDYLAPKQFSEMTDGWDNFATNFVSIWVIPIARACACGLVLSVVLVSLVKTRL